MITQFNCLVMIYCIILYSSTLMAQSDDTPTVSEAVLSDPNTVLLQKQKTVQNMTLPLSN